MKRNAFRLNLFPALIVATVLVGQNGCSAARRNLRKGRNDGVFSGRKVPDGTMDEVPIRKPRNATAGLDVPKPFVIDDAEKEFFNQMLEELTSFETSAPTGVASAPPVVVPTTAPSVPASPAPTAVKVTDIPSSSPTITPTTTPSVSPTGKPSDSSSDSPSEKAATPSPTASPSEGPSWTPSSEPTSSPSDIPSDGPSLEPSVDPSESPTATPTAAPTTTEPSVAPSFSPSVETPSPVAPTPAPVPVGPCNLTVQGRSALINIFLRVVSNPADVDTPGSPQQLALEWIINEDPMQLCPQDKFLIQRYVMSVFYFSTRGDRWTECSAPPLLDEDATEEEKAEAEAAANAACNLKVAGFESNSNAWLTGGNECGWGGLGCNEDDFITRIELEQNGVAGTLPSELSRLQTLRHLILEEGILTGTIPSKLGEIRSLEQIDLNFNLLQGPIPEELYLLSNLRQMDLNDNELTGTISSSISGLSKMSFFQIENNLFTGTVPDAMGGLTALQVATMDYNQLSGTMPCNVMNSTGTIKVLTSDCLGAPNRPSPPLVICECCTQCS
eukprot:CAMPEP_0116124914 /NCGR_PEP_ID=MMETSP0329-20121206/5535_1 /TAXON_ID=697910 /ORGANISM="Pseudo-nitzschia arenysensis, Strain B593" /LENGTH=556 /DNA_ID=CAMNT_0003618927 /DNA_START=166 /DNA_END=1836 /DNA_ORIENTATION=-